jgi:hypothetical protein
MTEINKGAAGTHGGKRPGGHHVDIPRDFSRGFLFGKLHHFLRRQYDGFLPPDFLVDLFNCFH